MTAIEVNDWLGIRYFISGERFRAGGENGERNHPLRYLHYLTSPLRKLLRYRLDVSKLAQRWGDARLHTPGARATGNVSISRFIREEKGIRERLTPYLKTRASFSRLVIYTPLAGYQFGPSMRSEHRYYVL